MNSTILTEQNRTEQNRQSLAIDYVKCIGIIFVLYGHYPNGNVWNVMSPYLFHMPLFFFLGGMLFNIEKEWGVFFGDILKKYILYIVITYGLLALFALILHEYGFIHKMDLFRDGIFETILWVLKRNFHNNYFFLVGWFLLSYMLILCFSYVLLKVIFGILNKNNFIVLLIIVLGLISGWVGVCLISPMYLEQKKFIYNIIAQVMVGGMFFLVGFSVKDYIFYYLNPVVSCLLFLFLVYLKQMGFIGSIYMSWSNYKFEFIYILIGALICIYIVFSICYVLAAVAEYQVFRYIGRSSKSIMVFHLFFFVLMSIIFDVLGLFDMDINNLNKYLDAPYAFPICMLVSIFGSAYLGDILAKVTKRLYI